MFNFKSLFNKQNNNQTYQTSYMYDLKQANWSDRAYSTFAKEAYIKNVIAYRSINMIAKSAASVAWHLHSYNRNKKIEIKHHPIIYLLHRPNPLNAGAEFFENLYIYQMISGNAYILAIKDQSNIPVELHLLRPDRISVLTNKNIVPEGYSYDLGNGKKIYYPIDKITGQSQILHIKNFHPLDDFTGLSPIEAASYSIDQHNQASIWNQSLLQNGARPSGALVIKGEKGSSYNLSDSEFQRLREEIDESFCGYRNTGRPILLEGGLEWKEMSLSPKDMDFIEAKNSSARDIALAFGVPAQLLGIPGDNTYSNLQEARISLWEETIIPMLDKISDSLNNWLLPYYDKNLKLSFDKEEISALASKREIIWQKIENASFMSINEKRQMLGLSPIEGGDQIIANNL